MSSLCLLVSITQELLIFAVGAWCVLYWEQGEMGERLEIVSSRVLQRWEHLTPSHGQISLPWYEGEATKAITSSWSGVKAKPPMPSSPMHGLQSQVKAVHECLPCRVLVGCS